MIRQAKSAALKVASTETFDELFSFVQSTMDEEILTLAKNFSFDVSAKIKIPKP